ncbi:hypothetical protein AOLI_G00249310 [Acnodon oligacanthus]
MATRSEAQNREMATNSRTLMMLDVEYRLRQGNLAHLKDGALLKVTKELKHEILERLAEKTYTFRAYPDDAEYDEIAAALVKKHPCLSERGSRNGWENQVYMEFTRIVGIDLRQYFYEGLDQHNSRLIEVFRTKRGLTGQILSKFLQQAKTSEPTVLRTLALRGLPVILGDNPEDFFKTDFVS